MTPKEKAKELHEQFLKYTKPFEDISARQSAIVCALIAVDEILSATSTERQVPYSNGEWSRSISVSYSDFWLQVKQEIEKL